MALEEASCPQARYQKIKLAKVQTLCEQGGEGVLGGWPDVPTSLVGEKFIGGTKTNCAHNDSIHPYNQ